MLAAFQDIVREKREMHSIRIGAVLISLVLACKVLDEGKMLGSSHLWKTCFMFLL